MILRNPITDDALSGPAAERPAKGVVRVLHVTSGNLYGGVETILATLARLRDLCPGMECEFALCFEGRLSAELREAGARVHSLGKVRISRPWTAWRARKGIRAILRARRFDAVICHMPWPLAVFGRAVRAEGIRLLFWAHGFHTGRGWLERLAKSSEPDLAIANSHFTRKGVANLFPDVPCEVLYAPMVLGASNEQSNWRLAVRKQYGIGEHEPVIIQVSRLERWKGHSGHLKALRHLRAMPWTCWMVGGAQTREEQRYLSELQGLAKELGLEGRVRFLGQRSDVAQLLAASDVFCQPNESPEPFGLALVEALASGCPVVTSGIGGALEIVDDSCGILVRPNDTDALAGALGRLIGSAELRKRLGEGGRLRARSISDPAKRLNSLLEFAGGPLDAQRN